MPGRRGHGKHRTSQDSPAQGRCRSSTGPNTRSLVKGRGIVCGRGNPVRQGVAEGVSSCLSRSGAGGAVIQRKVCARCWELTRLWGRTAETQPTVPVPRLHPLALGTTLPATPQVRRPYLPSGTRGHSCVPGKEWVAGLPPSLNTLESARLGSKLHPWHLANCSFGQ